MTTEVAIREVPPVGLSLIDGPNPAGAVAYARQVSAAIAGVLEEGSGFVKIQGRKHITIEGWQTMAAMTGHTVEVEWSRPVAGLETAEDGRHSWEARAVARDQSGRVVSAGEAMAGHDERAPWNKAEYSIRSMAQTRAQSRALASRMRYIVTLAGFAGTPADEMPTGDAGRFVVPPSSADVGKPRPKPKKVPVEWEVRWTELQRVAGEVDLSADALAATLKSVGAARPSDLADESLYTAAMSAINGGVGGDVIEGEILPDDPEKPETGQTILDRVKAPK